MRRWLLVPVGLLAAVMVAAPGTARAQASPGDAVVGDASGCLLPDPFYGCIYDLRLQPDAHSGPAGENPTGTVRVFINGGTPGSVSRIEADVSCLSVRGNVAVVGVTGRKFHTYAGVDVPTAGLIRVTDGDGDASGQDTFEFATRDGDLLDPPIPGPTDCSSYPTGGSSFPAGIEVGLVEVGDLTVIDSAPLPGARNQCKNGGWRNYGATFKNQGDCVSFVEHQARQECIFIRAAHGGPTFRAWYGTPVTERHATARCVWQRSDD